MMADETTLADLARAVGAARTIAVLTGSGLSAASGVPTFRDAQTGLWAHYRPEELANPEAFERDPTTVWQWYRARRQTLAEIVANDGHRALADLANELPDVRLITQNVDGLHQQAGHSNVIEFHGNIRVNQCHNEGREVEVDDAVDTPPACPHCGGLVRPGVVWFGEAIDPQAIERATQAAQACDVFLSVGTSAEVHPAAGLADLARRNGAHIAEINPDATPLSDRVTWIVRDSAARVLPELRRLSHNQHA